MRDDYDLYVCPECGNTVWIPKCGIRIVDADICYCQAGYDRNTIQMIKVSEEMKTSEFILKYTGDIISKDVAKLERVARAARSLKKILDGSDFPVGDEEREIEEALKEAEGLY